MVGKNRGLMEFSEAEVKTSSLVVDNIIRRDSTMVDLKLGNSSDQRDSTLISLNSSISNRNSSNVITKKSLQIAFCRVFGCRKDLSSSKDYYKRHKVCEVHSKTAKVIVNGVEQRFCQQCSRFHVLAEFDNGKRSCRRRLADHNERRRKHRVRVNSTRLGIFQDYNGFRIQDTISTSCISNPATSEQLHSKSVSIPYTSDQKQTFPPLFGENRGNIDEINEIFMQDRVTCSDIGSPSLFHNSVGSKNSVFVDSSSYYEGLSGMPSSGHALSLLSSFSQDSSNHSFRPLSENHW